MSSFCKEAKSQDLLQSHSWIVLNTKESRFSLSNQELLSLNHWESVFQTAFDLQETYKMGSGMYRVEKHVSVGYRHDEEREFFETRLTSHKRAEPSFNSYISRYDETVMNLYSGLNKIAKVLLEDIATRLGLDSRVFLDLTDIADNGILPFIDVPSKTISDGEQLCEDQPSTDETTENSKKEAQYSSSLLRICKYSYNNEQDILATTTDSDRINTTSNNNHVSFGAHTDSSFLTLALCSSTPGLELVDQVTNSWVCPERDRGDSKLCEKRESLRGSNHSSSSASGESGDIRSKNDDSSINDSGNGVKVIVFVGEFLQVLTKNRYKATVHRVMQYCGDPEGMEDQMKELSLADSSTVRDSNSKNTGSSIISSRTSGDKESGSTQSFIRTKHTQRISCPYLIRGRYNAKINFHSPDYTHPGGENALSADKIPDLDDTTMKLLHKLLDLKRQKCFRDNDSKPGSWVLSAFPIDNMPIE